MVNYNGGDWNPRSYFTMVKYQTLIINQAYLINILVAQKIQSYGMSDFNISFYILSVIFIFEWLLKNLKVFIKLYISYSLYHEFVI